MQCLALSGFTEPCGFLAGCICHGVCSVGKVISLWQSHDLHMAYNKLCDMPVLRYLVSTSPHSRLFHLMCTSPLSRLSPISCAPPPLSAPISCAPPLTLLSLPFHAYCPPSTSISPALFQNPFQRRWFALDEKRLMYWEKPLVSRAAEAAATGQ